MLTATLATEPSASSLGGSHGIARRLAAMVPVVYTRAGRGPTSDIALPISAMASADLSGRHSRKPLRRRICHPTSSGAGPEALDNMGRGRWSMKRR